MVTDGRAGIDVALVRRLVATQFPRWAGLEVAPVPSDGWDNRTYRLGTDLSVRLPTGAAYAPAVLKEHRWLPVLGPQLPLPLPEPVGLGRPGEGYPHPWSVNRWLPGETAGTRGIDDLCEFASDLAGFLRVLRSLDASGGPVAGAHSFFRGADLATYDEETRRCLVIAWTFLDASARQVFRRESALDEDTWRRARGWALWKALLGMAGDPEARACGSVERRVVDLVLDE